MIAGVPIAIAGGAAAFLLYPFGLEAGALLFYSASPALRKAFGVTERQWLVGFSGSALVILAITVALMFQARAFVAETVTRWSLFTPVFGTDQYIAGRVDIDTVYADTLICFAAAALLPYLVWSRMRSGAARPPLADHVKDVERWALAFITIQCACLYVKVHHMVVPLLPLVPRGQPRPSYLYYPVLDANADHGSIVALVAAATYAGAVLASAWPLLVRQIIRRWLHHRGQ